jgi:hypothetical protein
VALTSIHRRLLLDYVLVILFLQDVTQTHTWVVVIPRVLLDPTVVGVNTLHPTESELDATKSYHCRSKSSPAFCSARHVYVSSDQAPTFALGALIGLPKYPNMVLYIICLPSTIATENATLINAAIHSEIRVSRTLTMQARMVAIQTALSMI